MSLIGFNAPRPRSWVAALALTFFALGNSATTMAAPKGTSPSQAQSDIAFDPSASLGQLGNGLKYVIFPNAKPNKTLVLKFFIASGTYDETDSERGAAQTITQLALLQTRNFNEGAAKASFNAEGIQFGSARNNQAGINGTLYTIEIPNYSKTKVDLALKWMRDVADGVKVNPESVDKSRVNLLEAYNLSLGGPKVVADALNNFLGPQLRISKRQEIASPEEIKAITSKGVLNYYNKWYTPQNAYLIAVGDAPVDEVKAAIDAHFGTWKTASVASRFNSIPNTRKRGLEVFSQTFSVPYTIVTVCKTAEPNAPVIDNISNRKKYIQDNVWSEIINNRLANLAKNSNTPFSSVAVTINKTRDLLKTCIQATAVEGQWKIALNAIGTELTRLERHGILAEELSAIRSEKLAQLDKLASVASEQSSNDLAEGIAQAKLNGVQLTTPKEARRVTEAAWAGLTPAIAMQGFAKGWSGSGPLISVISDRPIEESTIESVWQDATSKGELAPPKLPGGVVWPYSDFGPAGVVTKREVIKPYGFTRLHFANGTTLNFKQSNYNKDYAWIRVRFGAGQRQIDPKFKAAVTMATPLFITGGLGKLSFDELRQANAEKQWGLVLTVSRSEFLLVGDTRLRDLDREVETMAAFLSDPGFRSEANVRIPAIADYILPKTTDPAAAAVNEFSNVFGTDNWMGLPSRDELLATQISDLAAAIKGPILREPLEVTVLGDLSEKDATALIARTFGALPNRLEAAPVRPDFQPINYPSAKQISVDVKDSKGEAAILAVWPTFIVDDTRHKDMQAIGLLTQILNLRLKEKFKASGQDSVTASAYPQFSNRFDRGAILLVLRGQGKDLTAAQTLASEVVNSMRVSSIPWKEFDAARKATIDASKSRRDTSSWWITIMDGSARDPSIVKMETKTEADLGALKPKDISDAAKSWLKPETMIQVFAMDEAQQKVVKTDATPASAIKP